MTNNKTFRLFISSTFNDFRREREVLQTKVFPTTKVYCSQKGYTFQPIDLRWGVTEEAQLDQKTLELCLNEVKACKTHLHPNFLIMIGDRYGWVPLPYAIEKEEYESIKQHMLDTTLLDAWYSLDLNQIPASYILKERTNKFEDYDTWAEVEKKLSTTLQDAVKLSTLTEEQKRKYFLSATEAEVEEGIIPYLTPTKFQKDVLLKKDEDLHTVDPQHIFGFFRDIDKSTQIEDKFIQNDYDEAQAFKKRVKPTLLEENRLQIQTTQIDKETLEEDYLEEFEERVLKFLKTQIDAQKRQEIKINLTPLQTELAEQEYFAVNKRKNFLGQDILREEIKDYISNDEQAPLVIYGESGSGKSALMSQAILEAQEAKEKRVLYRFVSSTPSASSSKDILTSIFEELGIDVQSEEEKEKKEGQSLSLDSDDKQETFVKFSYKIRTAIQNIEENVVIFIDAVDQLQNDDQFLWLPETLPDNVKIVISALEDDKYKDDSKLFDTLKTKTTNLHPILEFQEAEKLLEQLLKNVDRTVDDFQKKHFLEQFEKVQSPLYVNIAVQEMKNWKSGDESQTLSNTQHGIIEEYIANLSDVYHHDEKFVQKVLGYLYASKEGLSENELLQLLESDKAFVKLMADEEFHKNHTLELPLVHWSRLQTQLKPFLNLKTQDNETLMYFFHREFEDVIGSLAHQRDEHAAIIKTTQNIIVKNQDKMFEENRWGILYSTIVTEYFLRYADKEKYKVFSVFVGTLENLTWKTNYLLRIIRIAQDYQVYNRTNQSNAYGEGALHISYFLYQQDFKYWVQYYIVVLNNLSLSYFDSNRVDDAIKLGEQSLKIQKKYYVKNPELWVDKYIVVLNNLAKYYRDSDETEKSIIFGDENLKIIQELYKENFEKWVQYYIIALNNLSSSYFDNNRIDDAIKLRRRTLEIQKELYKNDSEQWAGTYSNTLDGLSVLYLKNNDLIKAIQLGIKSLKIRKQLYNKTPAKWVVQYIDSLSNLSACYLASNRLKDSINIDEENLEIVEKLYFTDKERWIKHYTIVLSNLAFSYSQDYDIHKAIKLQQFNIEILEKYYFHNNMVWSEYYVTAINNLADSFFKTNRGDEAIKLLENNLIILKNLYQKNPNKWVENYTVNLTNLSVSYLNNNRMLDAIKLGEESLNIIESHYSDNPRHWIVDYIDILNHLSITYYTKKMIPQAISLNEKTIKVLKNVYKYNPKMWIDKYIYVFNSLISMYNSLNQKYKVKFLIKEHKVIYMKQQKLKNMTVQISQKEPNRNDPCPCESGKKYKKCCGRN